MVPRDPKKKQFPDGSKTDSTEAGKCSVVWSVYKKNPQKVRKLLILLMIFFKKYPWAFLSFGSSILSNEFHTLV